MIIKTVSDRCKMTYKHYINLPMHMCEKKLNMNSANNPQLMKSVDRNNKSSTYWKI